MPGIETLSGAWPCVRFSTSENALTPDDIRNVIRNGRRLIEDPATRMRAEVRIALVCQWAEQWRSERSPWRKRAERMLVETSRLTAPMLNACLDLFFRAIKQDTLERLNRRLGSERRQVVGHVLPGNVLAASAESFLVDLVLGHVNVVKVSSRAPMFPLLVAETLGEFDARLGQLISILSWKGGDRELDRAFLGTLDRVVVYGTHETIGQIRRLVPRRVHMDEFGPGTSMGVIRRSELTSDGVVELAWRAAMDASLYDQRGCLSLQHIFVEEGGDISPRAFAQAVAFAMAGVANRYPVGERTVPETAGIRARRALWAMKEQSGQAACQWGDDAYRWTVLYEPVLKMDEPISGRVLTVRSFSSLRDLDRLIDAHKDSIQGLAVPNASAINRWHAFRIPHVSVFGALQFAPLAWQRRRARPPVFGGGDTEIKNREKIVRP